MGAAYCKNAWVKLRTHRLRPTFWLCSSDNKKYRKFQKIINLFFSDAGCNAACKLTWGRAVNIISAPEKSERKKKDDIAKHELRTMWHLPTLKKIEIQKNRTAPHRISRWFPGTLKVFRGWNMKAASNHFSLTNIRTVLQLWREGDKVEAERHVFSSSKVIWIWHHVVSDGTCSNHLRANRKKNTLKQELSADGAHSWKGGWKWNHGMEFDRRALSPTHKETVLCPIWKLPYSFKKNPGVAQLQSTGAGFQSKHKRADGGKRQNKIYAALHSTTTVAKDTFCIRATTLFMATKR